MCICRETEKIDLPHVAVGTSRREVQIKEELSWASVPLIPHLFDSPRVAAGRERHVIAVYNFGIANEGGWQQLLRLKNMEIGEYIWNQRMRNLQIEPLWTVKWHHDG